MYLVGAVVASWEIWSNGVAFQPLQPFHWIRVFPYYHFSKPKHCGSGSWCPSQRKASEQGEAGDSFLLLFSLNPCCNRQTQILVSLWSFKLFWCEVSVRNLRPLIHTRFLTDWKSGERTAICYNLSALLWSKEHSVDARWVFSHTWTLILPRDCPFPWSITAYWMYAPHAQPHLPSRKYIVLFWMVQ